MAGAQLCEAREGPRPETMIHKERRQYYGFSVKQGSRGSTSEDSDPQGTQAHRPQALFEQRGFLENGLNPLNGVI